MRYWDARRILTAGALAVSLAGCGPGEGGPSISSAGDEESASALTLTTWNWVPVTGAMCADGSATGMGVSTSDNGSSQVLVFMDGGGECYDSATCSGLTKTVTRTSYASTDFTTELSATAETVNLANPAGCALNQSDCYTWSKPVGSRGIFDRTSATNPFQHYNYVFIPYCTADFHSGNRYDNASTGVPASVMSSVRPASNFYFKGYANFGLFSAQIKATYAAPGKITLLGGSAGGFGALYDYPLLRSQYTTASTAINVISDAGTPLWTGDDVSSSVNNKASFGPRPGFVMYNTVSMMYPLSPLQTTCLGAACTNWTPTPTTMVSAYLEDRFNDAWGLSNTRASSAGTTSVTRVGAYGPIYPMQTSFLNVATWAKTNATNDRFGVIDSTEDFIYPLYFHLNPTHPNPPQPNMVTGILDLGKAASNLGLSNVHTLWVSSTATFNANLAPYNQFHTYSWSDVSTWGAACTGTPASGNDGFSCSGSAGAVGTAGSGLAAFLTSNFTF